MSETSQPRQGPIASILRHFAYEHLPPDLQAVSRPVCELAHQMAEQLPMDPETTVGLRKLLEAKDCFVRAELTRPKPEPTADPDRRPLSATIIR